MEKLSNQEIATRILDQARVFGADLSGFANVSDLKSAPSFILGPQISISEPMVGIQKANPGLKPGEASWPQNAKSVLVLGVAHPKQKPELDWWVERKSPPGNQMLISTAKKLCEWITQEFDLHTVHLPYHVEKGGIYLKDAAVMAGLGCVGKNNLFLTPEYGPRIRLRALTLDTNLPSTGLLDFDPCCDCKIYCRRACPQDAFKQKVFTPGNNHPNHLPGQDGTFNRPTCNIQMEKDISQANKEEVDEFDERVKVVKYCRRCELACPIGRSSKRSDERTMR